MTNDYREDLKSLLRNLFQFESADLDFGIYRIMNKKRNEIERFIEKDLIEAVDREFESYNEEYRKKIEKELDEIKSEIIEKIGEDAFELSEEIKKEFINLPISKKYYLKRNEFDKIDLPDQTKAEIFSHIYEFFSRYYEDGDFISLRRYSNDQKYAIPYNGEEVYLYWSNFDQYYIKTSENYRNYSFTSGDLKVNFLLSDIETAVTNDKEEDRFFILKNDEAIVYDAIKKEITIYLVHRLLSEDEKKLYQGKKKETIKKDLINKIHTNVISSLPDNIKSNLLRKEEDRTILLKHIERYTKINTMDYFIHKNLKEFFMRELDFYIKNEVIKINDMLNLDEVKYVEIQKKVKIIKNISNRIIEFIYQIEEFQKKLFEKKKFVLKTDYIVTLDRVPKELYFEICQNKLQIEEWSKLYKLDEIEQGTLHKYMGNSTQEIAPEYLEANPYLSIDTKYFNQNFKDKLLESFESIDENIQGLAIKSDNYHALKLLQDKYKEKIKLTYIDPPYNTGKDGFLYKDQYMSSSWLCMMQSRIEEVKKYLSDDGILLISVDDNECSNLRIICDKIFNIANRVDRGTLVWLNKGSTKGFTKIVKNHEYVLAYGKDSTKLKSLFGINYPEKLTTIEERLQIKRSPRNPISKVIFPKGLRIDNQSDIIFENSVGKGTNRIDIIDNDKKLIFENGKLKYDSTLEASFPYKNQMVEFFSNLGTNEKTFDTKDQEWLEVFFTSTGVPYYKKSRGTSILSSILEKIGNSGTPDIEKFGLLFDNPKPVAMITKFLDYFTTPNHIIMDFLAGSGTTAEAAIRQKRKYLVIEILDYFDSIILLRIKKSCYSSEWKNGIPKNKKGNSHLLKYQYLEQYEDSLDNIEFIETGGIQKTLSEMDDYFLKYMLDFETRGSTTRLNINLLEDPFKYKMKINGNYETIDLVETFNYLLGLTIIRIKAYTYSNVYYRVVYGEKDNEKIIIIWRKSKDINLDVDKDFIENNILKEFPSDKIYVNGENYVHKAIPIELEFKRQMEA